MIVAKGSAPKFQESRTPSESRPAVSVIVPCFNEREVLPEFHRRMAQALISVGRGNEIIYVDDGSRDGTDKVLAGLTSPDTKITIVQLSRNFGHQLAVSAGMHYAEGTRALIIDADLQDPPELLPEMMKAMDAGADVVYGKRKIRAGESVYKRSTASAFYRMIGHLSGTAIPRDTGDFRLISHRVLELINGMPEQHRFLRGMIAMVGFNQVPIEYDRDARFAGSTKYPLRKMIALAIDGITGFATAPLRDFFYLSAFSAVLAFILFIWTAYSFFAFAVTPGWPSVMATVLLFSAIQIFGLALIGEYVGRTFIQAKGRPLFIVKSVHGRDPELDAQSTRGKGTE